MHFFVLLMLIHTLGGASGAHFNPAVTVTLAALRKIAPADAAIYVVLQLARRAPRRAGRQGAARPTRATRQLRRAGGLPRARRQGFAGFFAEMIGTFVLMWAIMGVAVNPRARATGPAWPSAARSASPSWRSAR